MRIKKNQLIIIALFTVLFGNCATKLVDIKKQNPKLFKELIKDYNVASEDQPGKIQVLKFIDNEERTVVGKIDKFPIESCNWFFDRKLKNKTNSEESLIVSKTINLNCGGQYYIIEFDRKNLNTNKLKYKGHYKNIFRRLSKAIILEAACSIQNTTGKDDDLEKNTAIECYPYPFDLERYTKTQRREVVAGYFLYTDSQETLTNLMEASLEEKENDKILLALKEDFVDEETANDQNSNPSIGESFVFKNCEFIDFRELPVENARGKELKEKIDKFVESDLSDASNKEGLRDAIEEYRNCGSRCLSREKEVQLYFEMKNAFAKRKILLIKKIESKSELSKYKRFNFYPVDGELKSIDFSEKGEIEKIYLNPNTDDSKSTEKIKSEKKSSVKKNYKETNSFGAEDKEEKPKKANPFKATEKIEPVPEPEENEIEPETKLN